MPTSNRQADIVTSLHIKPSDHVLEIGCGQGVAATFVCQQIGAGKYVGVDRSQKMIDTAVRRNRQFVDNGKATFVLQELEDLDLGSQQFDKIFAVRVRLFHTEPERARQQVEKYLKPGGSITVVYDTPN